MPMIKCSECGAAVSDRLGKCPHCGAQFVKRSERYSQFYEKPKQSQLYQPEPNYIEDREEKRPVRSNTKSTALSISAIILSFMGLLTSFIAIIIASSSPKEVYVEKEVPVYLESDQSESISDIEKAEIKEEVIPTEIEKETKVEKKEEIEKIEELEEETNEEDTENKEDQEVSNIFYVGDVLETKKIKLSYIACGDYIDENMFVEAGENNKLIYFEFEFENIGTTDTSVGYYDFDCYADGYEAKNSMCTADNAMTSIATLSPGRRMGGIVVFEVPKNSETIEVEYETSFWTQDKAIFMYK